MSTSEAQIFARALYTSLIENTLQSLRTAAEKLNGVTNDTLEQRLATALPSDAPREVQNFLRAMAREGALTQLPAVAQEFQRYAQESQQQALAGEITSAVELDAQQQQHILDELRTRYGQKLTLSYSVDPSLIGGLIIRIGDQVLDNSLRARMSAIQRNMLTS